MFISHNEEEPLLPLRSTDGREPEHHDTAVQVQRQGA